ncbi:putative protein of unknown function (DUF 659) [Lyophyllum shimeji]|uniref:HAT C-terminal dimerisation domain-containing protein n=1 Tax=Lyophyllum shimeji TaxID=47721 RepID=A0A9P3UTT0_LYOSH|nr:putative protein of unknown function (DUF 659) [Lyophyllum shimeji]
MSGTSTPISSFIVVSSRPIPIPIYLTEYFSFQETRRGANRAWEISEQLHHCHLNKPYHRVFLLAHSTPWLHSTPPVCFMSLPLCSCALTGSTSCFLHTSEALNAMDSNDYTPFDLADVYGRKFPWILVLDCYAHQINLVVGDYFKSNTVILVYAEQATELIAWIRSKTLPVLGLIRESQIRNLGPARTKAIIRAALTRWTAHYMAFHRLVELHQTLISVIYADEALPEPDRKIVIGDAKAKAKARSMIAIIKNPTFWHSILRMTRHLRPLAIAANVVQAAFCRVDQVLLTFGYLVMQYRAMTDEDDAVGCNAIVQSIERRWAKADQEVFIAAVILNPLYQTTPFAQLPSSTMPAYIHCSNASGRGFFERIHHWNSMSNCESISIERNLAEQQRRTPNPLHVFDGFCFPGRPAPVLIQLATHILSISANSASCERLFSVFGNTLNKLRNRLGTDNLTALTELKMHIRDEHVRNRSKDRVKRQFTARGTNPATTSSSGPEPSVTPTASPVAPQAPPVLAEPLTDADLNTESSSPSSNSFHTMASLHCTMVDLDDADNDPVRESAITDLPVPIVDLFDFTSTHWVDAYGRAAVLSFDEELELYELLDLDAEGEEDVDIAVDESMADILLG